MAKKKEYEEIEGILCEVKNPARKSVVRFYQESLRPEIDKYIGNNRMVEKKKAYADALEVNLIIAPFVLGWLRRPSDDEYQVITGRMTMDELNKKRESTSKPATKKRATKKPANKEVKTIVSKPTPPKKPEAPKKPTPPKKPVLKKEDSKGHNGAIKGSKTTDSKATPATKKIASPTKPVDKKKESAPIKGATKGSQTAQ